jgi:hypothetical protein
VERLRLSGQFRYLAADPHLSRQQREQAAFAQAPSPTAVLSTQTALWVLVEYIKEPGLSVEQIATRLREQRNLAVAPESIQRFFQEHGLKKRLRHPTEHAGHLAELPGEVGAREFSGLSVRATAYRALSARPD